MKRLLLLTTLLCSVMLSAKEYELLSPDGKISVHIASGERFLYHSLPAGIDDIPTVPLVRADACRTLPLSLVHRV